MGFEDSWVAEVSGFPGFFIHSVWLAPGGMKRASVLILIESFDVRLSYDSNKPQK